MRKVNLIFQVVEIDKFAGMVTVKLTPDPQEQHIALFDGECPRGNNGVFFAKSDFILVLEEHGLPGFPGGFAAIQ